jgi:small subunit ribosomal protein S15
MLQHLMYAWRQQCLWPCRRHPGDCGSSEFQIAVLTARVKHLTPHMQRNRKDLATRRALVAILERRKKVMKYLYYQDKRKFVGLVKDLGIRNPLKGLDMILEDRPEDMVTPTEELEGIVGKKQGNQVEGPVSELEATEPTEEEAEAVAKLQGQESPDGL